MAKTVSASLPYGAGPGQSDSNRSQDVQFARQSNRTRISVWPMVIVIYATLLPREACIHIGGNYLYADRLALLLMTPWIIVNLWRGVIKFVLPDWLILTMGVWIVISMCVNLGIDRGLFSGSAFAIDAVGGYFLARVSFHSLTDVRRGLILCAPAVFLAASTLPMESFAHHPIVRPAFEKVFGSVRTLEGTDEFHGLLRIEIRHGLMRAYGPWAHPIIAGLFLSTLVGIYWMSGIRGWPRWLALAAAMLSVFSLSSATLLALGMQFGMIGYDWLTRKVAELTWPLLFTFFALFLGGVEVYSKSGLIPLVVRFLTLDPTTGYFRLLIWQFGWISVLHHPWFGIGLSDYSRPEWMISNSVDAHWLLLAMRYGVIPSAALFISCLSALFALGRSQAYANPRDRRFYRGIMFSLFTFVVMGFTVYIFGGTQTWFTILLGACVACSQHGFSWVVILPDEERAAPQDVLAKI